jgi:hypothetical protein
MTDARDDDRAEIEEDLRTQGLADEVSYEDVASTFGLFETSEPPDLFGPPPSPAFGEAWRYVPEPGEESLFAETGDMHFPPATD